MRQRPLVEAPIIFSIIFFAAVASAEDGSSTAAPPSPRISFAENAEEVRGVLLKLYLKTSVERAWAVVSDRQPTKPKRIEKMSIGTTARP